MRETSLANCTELTDAGAVALRKGTQCKKLQWLVQYFHVQREMKPAHDWCVK